MRDGVKRIDCVKSYGLTSSYECATEKELIKPYHMD